MTAALVSAAGRLCIDAIPIPAETNQVGHFLDKGELLVTFTYRFERIVDIPRVVYNDAELLIRTEEFVASLWRPLPPEGFVASDRSWCPRSRTRAARGP